jgi:hypothetical protein
MPVPHDYHTAETVHSWWYLLLLVPFIALLWVPLYNRIEPSIFGIPFFYWYQFLWVILTSLLIIIVDIKTRSVTAGDNLPAGEGHRP